MNNKLKFDCGNRNEDCNNATICPCLLLMNKHRVVDTNGFDDFYSIDQIKVVGNIYENKGLITR